MGIREKCIVCGDKKAELGFDLQSSYRYISCPICGKYILPESTLLDFVSNPLQTQGMKQKLAHYLFYNKFDGYQFVGTQEEFNICEQELPQLGLSSLKIKKVTQEEVNSWYPKTFAEKIDKILLYLNKRNQYIGEVRKYSYLDLLDIYMIDCEEIDPNSPVPENYRNQIYYYSEYLRESGYMKVIVPAVINGAKWSNNITFQFAPKGLARIDELQKSQSNNNNVFVSMAFNNGTEGTRNAIRQGIIEAGYSAEFIDEIIHNHQIIPEMLRLIRECRFLILDITDPNFGAYYEAGYAAGLDKEVIVCCKKEVFERKDFQCEYLDNVKVKNKQKLQKDGCGYFAKATKPHFDIAQKQTLVWDDYNDLTKKLTLWIKSIIG